jgi:DNA-binding NtrC family response regulator/tetratricopeptide (TPR) repeat protein
LYTKKLRHPGIDHGKTLDFPRGRTLAASGDRDPTTMLLADRYLHSSGGWIDLATARAVLVAISDAGARRDQIAWAERCAMLSTLRHPLLNPLIDFGVATPTSLFEVYAPRGPLIVPSSAAHTLVTHAARFLAAHGVELSASIAPLLFRGIERTRRPVSRDRPLGLVLQPRPALETLTELLTDAGTRGARTVRVAARPGMGLRTLWWDVARRARAEGFVAICPEALEHWPQAIDYAERRHVCLLMAHPPGRGPRAAAATLLARAGRHGGRPHVCLVAQRTDTATEGAIHVQAMGRTAMTGMVYVDPDYGPTAAEILEAARRSEGCPGHFVSYLTRGDLGDSSRSFMVHESPEPYLTEPVPRPAAGEPASRPAAAHSRIGSVLWRAGSRAGMLQSRGRHTAAARLLTRAARALEGRNEPSQAARYWLQLGWMSRARGALAQAHDQAARAARADGGAECQILAGLLDATCWTDDRRVADAEGALRSLIASASTLGSQPLEQECRVALARTLCWADRHPEAAVALSAAATPTAPPVASSASIIRSRILRQSGDLAGAMRSAREALTLAERTGDFRLLARAHRALAETHAGAGDLERVQAHVHHGLTAARTARLPIALLRLRVVLFAALQDAGAAGEQAARLRAGLERAGRHTLPAGVALAIDTALGRPRGLSPAIVRAVSPPVEEFLDLTQRARDDGHAVAQLAAATCARVGAAACVIAAVDGRTLANAGRPWREPSPAMAQVLAGARLARFDPHRQPPEAAEPIRCGGDLVGAIGCRWIAGASAVAEAVSEVLHAASVAAAGHVRTLLEHTSPPPPGVWGDLLGESAAAIALRESMHRAARAPFPVLIEGESGSGKELVARAIHKLSPRHTRRFCAINCAALSDELIEAELFGHTKGAFTGAATERAGLFEEADGGTLFLDEVGELSARAQAKLLRVIQEGEVRRVGENLPRHVDVRIVSATNRRLEREAAEGRFRTDLRFRLDVLRIIVPALRERPGDVPLLAQHFWRAATDRLGSQAVLGPDALAALARYDWPGNVRELQNAIAWMAVHAPRRGRISSSSLPAHVASMPLATGSTFELAREEFERRYVKTALAQAGGQRQAAAKALGVTRQGLSKMLRRLGIEP